MSELTKIAAILFKNLSDALLTTASELSKLNTPAPLSQANDKPELVSLQAEKPKLIKRQTYKSRDRVMVLIGGSEIPLKYRILKQISTDEYLAYPQMGLKEDARRVSISAILGLDPDR